jgi:transposase-like protein
MPKPGCQMEWGLSLEQVGTLTGIGNKARRRDREALAEVLKRIYRSSNKEEERKALSEQKEVWGRKYPQVVRKWEENLHDLGDLGRQERN